MSIKEQALKLIEDHPGIRTSAIIDTILDNNPAMDWDATIKATVEALDQLKVDNEVEAKPINANQSSSEKAKE